jgi:hypothetical protein
MQKYIGRVRGSASQIILARYEFHDVMRADIRCEGREWSAESGSRGSKYEERAQYNGLLETRIYSEYRLGTIIEESTPQIIWTLLVPSTV